MDFSSFWAAFAAMWPLRMGAKQAPLLLTPDTNPVVIPPSGTATVTMQLPGDCDIQVDDWVATSSHTSFPNIMGFRVTMFYGNDWSLNYPAPNAIAGENIFGTAQRPGRIGYRPWWIETYGNRGLLQFNFSNTQTITTSVEICLRGHRVGR